jgi:hypothetical protein
VTLEGRPIVIEPAEADTSTSLAVPASEVTTLDAKSLICDAFIEIVELLAAVKRP